MQITHKLHVYVLWLQRVVTLKTDNNTQLIIATQVLWLHRMCKQVSVISHSLTMSHGTWSEMRIWRLLMPSIPYHCSVQCPEVFELFSLDCYTDHQSHCHLLMLHFHPQAHWWDSFASVWTLCSNSSTEIWSSALHCEWKWQRVRHWLHLVQSHRFPNGRIKGLINSIYKLRIIS